MLSKTLLKHFLTQIYQYLHFSHIIILCAFKSAVAKFLKECLLIVSEVSYQDSHQFYKFLYIYKQFITSTLCLSKPNCDYKMNYDFTDVEMWQNVCLSINEKIYNSVFLPLTKNANHHSKPYYFGKVHVLRTCFGIFPRYDLPLLVFLVFTANTVHFH